MTERYGPGYGEEGGHRPSGRGAVTERLARQDHGNEIDLTDETTERESSGAFEPAPPGASAGPAGDPPAEEDARTGASNIFDVEERAKDEATRRSGPVSHATATWELGAVRRSRATSLGAIGAACRPAAAGREA